MASDTNSLTISGRLGRDPEIRFTGGGSAVASASVVVGRSWKNKTTDEWENQDFWIKVTAWGTLGENFAQSCMKGDKIVATGRLEVREYDKKDGSKGTSVEMVADCIGPELRFATAEVSQTERKSAKQVEVVVDAYADEEPFG